MASTTIALNQVPRASDKTQALVDAERLRIARELHDVIAFSFATIHVQAGVAVHLADQRPDLAAEALGAIKAISAEASRELHAVIGGLRRTRGGGDGPFHGVAELDSLAATATRSGLATRVVVSGRARSLPPAVDRAAYRIVQEALTNAVRHAGPACAVVTVGYEPDRLVIHVVDDGRGLERNETEPDPGHGYGIAGMRERALALGGELDVGPDPLGGFQVRASVPIGAQS
jgi:signal transduction histidine kinase